MSDTYGYLDLLKLPKWYCIGLEKEVTKNGDSVEVVWDIVHADTRHEAVQQLEDQGVVVLRALSENRKEFLHPLADKRLKQGLHKYAKNLSKLYEYALESKLQSEKGYREDAPSTGELACISEFQRKHKEKTVFDLFHTKEDAVYGREDRGLRKLLPDV